jgi:hypothetical protein
VLLTQIPVPLAAGSPAPPPAPPADEPAEVGVRLLDAPVNRRTDPRALHYIVDHVHPGTTIRRRIVVANPSPVRRQTAVYAAAADIDKDGFTFAPDATQNELSSWVRLERNNLDLADNAHATLWVTIDVPANASEGERYAVIWAQVAADTNADTNVRSVGRAGIRIYLSVGPGGEPPSDFQISGLTGRRTPDNLPVLTADIRNTGKRALDLAGELSLTHGPGGLSVAPTKIQAPTLGLGETATVRVVLDRQLPDGPWSAELALASGWVKRTTASVITFGPQAPIATPTATQTDNTRILTIGGIGSLLVMALLAGTAYRRRNRPKQ